VASPEAILARIRAHGANVILDEGKLRFINGKKLPPDAAAFIGQHRDALIAHLQDEADEIDERSAIIEYDGNTPRAAAERFAREIAVAKGCKTGAALQTYLDACGLILDRELGQAA
jgi:hypothetical protein